MGVVVTVPAMAIPDGNIVSGARRVPYAVVAAAAVLGLTMLGTLAVAFQRVQIEVSTEASFQTLVNPFGGRPLSPMRHSQLLHPFQSRLVPPPVADSGLSKYRSYKTDPNVFSGPLTSHVGHTLQDPFGGRPVGHSVSEPTDAAAQWFAGTDVGSDAAPPSSSSSAGLDVRDHSEMTELGETEEHEEDTMQSDNTGDGHSLKGNRYYRGH